MYTYNFYFDDGYRPFTGLNMKAESLDEAVRKAKNLLSRNMSKYADSGYCGVNIKKDGRIVGHVGFEAKKYYPVITEVTYIYMPKGSKNKYLINKDGSRSKLN